MLLDPRIRVHNAAIKCSKDLASILSGENAQQKYPNGVAFTFDFPVVDPEHPLVESPFPSTDIAGEIRWLWYEGTAIIQIGARRSCSYKLHSVILSPPDATKDEVITWLGNKDTWDLMEKKWWELYDDVRDD